MGSGVLNLKVIPFVNLAPECDPIEDQVAGLNNKGEKHTFKISGINDGNDGSQKLKVVVGTSTDEFIYSVGAKYYEGTDSAIVSYYLREIGETILTFLISDDAGTELG